MRLIVEMLPQDVVRLTAVGHVADISEGLLRIDSDVIHIIGETIMKKQNKTKYDSCCNGHCKMIDQTRQ